jgi:hypothetical protein
MRFAVFGLGAIIMCAIGRSIALSWEETAFMLGAVMVVTSGMCIAGKEIEDGTKEDNEVQGQQTVLCEK